MSKNNKRVPVSGANLDEQEKKLQAQLEAIKQKRVKQQAEDNQRIADKVNAFLKEMGVNAAGAIALIKSVEKGTLGKVATAGRTYTELTSIQEADLKSLLIAGEVSVGALAVKFGVSEGTVNNRKAKYGLVQKRKGAAEAAAVFAGAPEAPAPAAAPATEPAPAVTA